MKNIQTEKLKLIEWLAGVNDNSVLEKIKLLKQQPEEAEQLWDSISEAEKKSIERGLKDIKNKNTFPHSQVKRMYAKWL